MIFIISGIYIGGFIGTTSGILLIGTTQKLNKVIGWGLIWPVVHYKIWTKTWKF